MSLLSPRARGARRRSTCRRASAPTRRFAGVAGACAKLLRGARASSRCRRSSASSTRKGSATPCPRSACRTSRAIEKTVFSAARADGFDLGGRDQALVCGIETHVCVSQTVHDLLDARRRGARARRRGRLAARDRLRARAWSAWSAPARSSAPSRRAVRAARARRHARVQGRAEADHLMSRARLRAAGGRHTLRRRGLRRGRATPSARSSSRPACPATRSR